MICVDSSALFAIASGEPEDAACIARLVRETQALISAATLAEVMIVCRRRDLDNELRELLDTLDLVVVDVDAAAARRAAAAYAIWGRGRHSARLNYGDCFAYEVAQRYGCPLLFVGDDFSQTDIQSAL